LLGLLFGREDGGDVPPKRRYVSAAAARTSNPTKSITRSSVTKLRSYLSPYPRHELCEFDAMRPGRREDRSYGSECGDGGG
jgi:hypothetical protein